MCYVRLSQYYLLSSTFVNFYYALLLLFFLSLHVILFCIQLFGYPAASVLSTQYVLNARMMEHHASRCKKEKRKRERTIKVCENDNCHYAGTTKVAAKVHCNESSRETTVLV